MSLRQTMALGGGAWIIYVGLAVPSIHHGAWAYALLLLAAFILVPLALDLLERTAPRTETDWWMSVSRTLQFPGAVLLAWSSLQEPGAWPGIAAIPWFLVCAFTAIGGCWRVLRRGARQSADSLSLDCALVFLGVGGAWVMADRIGFAPLDFPGVIVTLTAIHFHYAGLLLPLSAGLVVRRFPASQFARTAALGVVLGVPLVAVGITMTQLGFNPWSELAAGAFLAVCAMVIGVCILRIAFDPQHSAYVRVLFIVAGCSLIFGMILAGIYAARSWILPLPWLDIPWMRALHGSANALGFGLCGVLAWRATLLKKHRAGL
jgi:hypothetical protein